MIFGGGRSGHKNDVWTLNLTTYNWTEVASHKTKRGFYSSILYDGKMVMFGGSDGNRKNGVWTLI